jgi:2-phospho-L-lactate guanylyltransferase
MCIWAIIPVKPLNRAKSRLADVLEPDQRRFLAETMLRHVLETVRAVPQVMGTLVISRDTKVLSIAREYEARTVQESGAPELNTALLRATKVVASWGCNATLVLPADLPLIAPEDVMNIVNLGRSVMSVVISTDQSEDGTNALYMRPPGLIPYAFGPGSYSRHLQLAREAGAEVNIYRSDRLSLDIDLPVDLDNYNHLVRGLDYEVRDFLISG